MKRVLGSMTALRGERTVNDMMNAQLIGLSREVALRREMNVLANNLANLNTNGFRGEAIALEEYRMPIARAEAFRSGNEKLLYVQDWATVRDLDQGPIRITNNDLDVAIDGEGYFAINTPEGIRYTRNGSFEINPDGFLVTKQGYPVAGADGPIVVDDNATNIAIASDGTVSTDDGQIGTLQILAFEDEQALQKIGENLYATEALGAPALNTRLVQGALEGSNVEPIREMSRMIEVQRAYQLQARLVRDADSARRNAIDKLGTLNA
jgi:flagellar basal-body rod protein FlgF